MSEETETTIEEKLNLDIEIVVDKDGEVTQVLYKGVETRALVRDYQVQFPCVANGLNKDEDGELYMEIVV